MSFPPYSEYEDSGVKWLGDLPSHWQVKKIGHLADLITGFAFPSEGFSFDDSDSTIPLVRGESVSEGYLRWGERGRYWPKDSPYEERYLLDVDDIVVQMDGSKVGKNWAIVREEDLPLLLVQRVTRIRCREINPNFVFSLIANEMFVRYVDQAKTDPAVPHITMRNISDYWIPVPPEDEQKAISSFLDVETSKIDGLVSEQRRLIELLKEKRQAVISHAVTKGLNPNAPMKPSGIQWLGDVPQHWSVVPVKRLIEVKDGTHATPAYVDPAEDTFPLITSKDFGEETICFDETKHISADDHEEVVKRSNTEQGDVLMSMIGGNIGKALIVQTDRQFSIKNVALFKTTGNPTIARFVLYYLQSGLLDVQIDLLSRGGAQGFLGLGDIRNLVFFKVPPDELDVIVDELNERVAGFTQLLAEAERAIELLQERRTAIISAAVTGKIDVREFAYQETT